MRKRSVEGYDTQALAVGRLQSMLATSAAVSKDIGLLATFLGIGLIVNVIVVFIAVLVRGERQQNQQQR
jgi:heme/copper-type cytochrome/quinol oxidase subunit 2